MTTLEQTFNDARRRILNGEDLGIEETKRLVAALREHRFAAATASTTAKAKKAPTGASDEDLNSALDAMGL